MFDSLEVKVLPQPDGGKGSEPQGRHREVRSEGSEERTHEPMDKNQIRGVRAGRASMKSRSPYPSRAPNVNLAGACGQRSNVSREICAVSAYGTERAAKRVIATQKSAEDVVGAAVGPLERDTHLKGEKWSGLAGPETRGRRSDRPRVVSRRRVSCATGDRKSSCGWPSMCRPQVKPGSAPPKGSNRSRRGVGPNARHQPNR